MSVLLLLLLLVFVLCVDTGDKAAKLSIKEAARAVSGRSFSYAEGYKMTCKVYLQMWQTFMWMFDEELAKVQQTGESFSGDMHCFDPFAAAKVFFDYRDIYAVKYGHRADINNTNCGQQLLAMLRADLRFRDRTKGYMVKSIGRGEYRKTRMGTYAQPVTVSEKSRFYDDGVAVLQGGVTLSACKQNKLEDRGRTSYERLFRYTGIHQDKKVVIPFEDLSAKEPLPSCSDRFTETDLVHAYFGSGRDKGYHVDDQDPYLFYDVRYGGFKQLLEFTWEKAHSILHEEYGISLPVSGFISYEDPLMERFWRTYQLDMRNYINLDGVNQDVLNFYEYIDSHRSSKNIDSTTLKGPEEVWVNSIWAKLLKEGYTQDAARARLKKYGLYLRQDQPASMYGAHDTFRG